MIINEVAKCPLNFGVAAIIAERIAQVGLTRNESNLIAAGILFTMLSLGSRWSGVNLA